MVNYWKLAADKVREIATRRNLPVYWGSGNPIEKPHIVAVTRDAYQEAAGYDLYIYPEGGGECPDYEQILLRDLVN